MSKRSALAGALWAACVALLSGATVGAFVTESMSSTILILGFWGLASSAAAAAQSVAVHIETNQRQMEIVHAMSQRLRRV